MSTEYSVACDFTLYLCDDSVSGLSDDFVCGRISSDIPADISAVVSGSAGSGYDWNDDCYF